MHPLSAEAQTQLDAHLSAVAEILYSHTEAEKLQDFESIEWELRDQILHQVAPHLGEFFSQAAGCTAAANSDTFKAASERSPSATAKGNA
jgi:hypothetical protein